MKTHIPRAIVARNLRAVGVGGTVGAAAAVALYFMAPAVRRSGISLDAVTALGAAVGTAVHHSILPVLAMLGHYRRMLELVLARRVGWMTDESTARIMQTIQERYFLGSDKVHRGSHTVHRGSEKVQEGSGKVPSGSAAIQRRRSPQKIRSRRHKPPVKPRKGSPLPPSTFGLRPSFGLRPADTA